MNRKACEPSAGAGVFIAEAASLFTDLENITAVEKDILSGRVLTALGSSIPIPVIVSNTPFGNFKVYDEQFKDENITGKIHNYFLRMGLKRLKTEAC